MGHFLGELLRQVDCRFWVLLIVCLRRALLARAARRTARALLSHLSAFQTQSFCRACRNHA